MCVYTMTYAHTCAYQLRSQCQMSSFVLHLILFFWQSLELTYWLDCLASEHPGSFSLHLWVLGLQTNTSVPGLLHMCWDQDSGPPVCTARAFTQ